MIAGFIESSVSRAASARKPMFVASKNENLVFF
jgi:hypothetical protein